VAAVALLDAGHVDASDSGEAPQTLPELQVEAREVIGEHYTFASMAEALEVQREQSPRWSPLIEAAWLDAFHEVGGQVVPKVSPDTYARAYRGFQERPPSGAWPALAAAGIPVLLLLAGRPEERQELQRAAAARFAAAVPQAELRWKHDNGHNLVVELGEELGDELAGWLAGVGWR
jgi:hypothetical protein